MAVERMTPGIECWGVLRYEFFIYKFFHYFFYIFPLFCNFKCPVFSCFSLLLYSDLCWAILNFPFLPTIFFCCNFFYLVSFWVNKWENRKKKNFHVRRMLRHFFCYQISSSFFSQYLKGCFIKLCFYCLSRSTCFSSRSKNSWCGFFLSNFIFLFQIKARSQGWNGAAAFLCIHGYFLSTSLP